MLLSGPLERLAVDPGEVSASPAFRGAELVEFRLRRHLLIGTESAQEPSVPGLQLCDCVDR